MNKKKGLIAVMAALVVAGFALSGCSSSGGSSAASGTHALTIGMPNGPQTDNSNPFLNTSAARSLGYAFAIYEPLAEVNDTRPASKPVPWLAKSWTWNSDYTQLVLTARSGVKWSDGKPFTAADIAYSLQLRKDNPALNAEGLPYGNISTSGNTVTVDFTTSQYVNQIKALQLFIVPKHIWQNIKDPTTDLNQKPVGTGPYVLKNWTQQAVILDKNPHYWGGKLAVPELQYTSYSGNDTLTTALSTGAAQWGWTFIADYQSVFIDKDKAHNQAFFPAGLGVDYMALNVQKAPFNDVAVRQALNLVINRPEESKVAESGIYPELTSVTGIPTPAGKSFISSDYAGKNFKVDVTAAKKVLTDAGYTYKGSTLIGKDGKPVSFTVQDPAGWNDYDTGLQLIANSAKSIGIEAKSTTPSVDAWTAALNTGDFQASMHWTNSGVSPWEMYSDIFDPSYYVPAGKTAVWNYGRYQNPAAAAAFKAYTDATDDAGRAAALNTIQKIFVEDVPGIAMDARPAGAEFSTEYYTGWPSEKNAYANPQPTVADVAYILTKLKATN
jgi:peptide/nickel transport system substrate-binding protein